jgi:hypothetical protein
MPQLLIPALLASVLAVAGTAGSHVAPRAAPAPLPEPSGWSASVTHPFFPLRPGTVYVYLPRAGGRSEVDTMTVTHDERRILGIPAVVVRDRTYHHGVLVEDTADWYAQDKDGNVWYLGEDTKEYQNGKVVGTAGSWEAGKNGAEPGIMMRARPQVGDRYRQEYRRRVAEDMARVLSVSEAASVPFGAFTQCLETEEWSPLEPGARERKYYARGVGMVLQRTVAGGNEEMVLVKVIRH